MIEQAQTQSAIRKSQTALADAVEPTPFMQLAAERAEAACRWMLRSIEVNRGGGSSDLYSRWFKPFHGWGWPYPETTGYMIPTLLEYAAFSRQPEFERVAIQQADWILTLQFSDGALPGHDVVRGVRKGPSVFNTGQMVLGLVAAFDHTNEQRYLDGALRASRWLAGGVDEKSGVWRGHNYVEGFSPSYHARVAWPMLETWSRTRDEPVRTAAVRALDTIVSWQKDNGAIEHWSFFPGRAAFTHTIAYTLDGLLEGGRILGEAGRAYSEAAYKCSDVLRRKLELRGRLAGAYDLEWRGKYWYTCLTGNCQMAIIWMLISDRWNDLRFFSAALKALQPVIASQRLRHIDRNVRGAIPGSRPFWGRYLTMRYPNWAPKFFVDALLMARARLGRLLESDGKSLPSGSQA